MPNSIGKKEEINAKEKSSGVGNTGDSIWWSENDTDRYGYILTTKGNDELKKKGEISFVKELNIQPQIGLINIQNSVSGSVF